MNELIVSLLYNAMLTGRKVSKYCINSDTYTAAFEYCNEFSRVIPGYLASTLQQLLRPASFASPEARDNSRDD